MKILTLLQLRCNSILFLYHLIFFSTIDHTNQLKSQVSLSNKSYKILPIIDGCKEVFGCKRIENLHFFNTAFGICEKCRGRSLEVECPSISVINDSYQLLSFTNGFNKEFHKIREYNKTISIIEKDIFNGSVVLLSGKFVDFSGVENCALDKENQIELLQETYLIYNQYQNNEDLVLSIELKKLFQTNEGKTLEIISDWEINNKNSNHAMYAYTKLKEKVYKTKSEINSAIYSKILNNIWSLINITYNSNNLQILDQVKPCIIISCRKSKKNEFNHQNIDKGKRTTIRDIITSVNTLKSKAKSDSDYLLYVNIFIKTLLKSLKRKTERGKISIGCSNKMVSWVKELCEILEIRTDENSNMGRYISEFVRKTEKEANLNKKTTGKNVLDSEKNTKFIEAELEDYKKLEEELKEF
ncbi:uncharacterized protein cubi_02916 [Cryptosporidium ubiquitum]|uniref:Uncharacterized protein n=1 Tax=Cryptosporidium ubiquitum TaxID=857276 RepID=A0A1J4MIM6_9CRYT|nr:uncharacterized protein cubi_02916 [Cryptosporidium ubiquitum]OII74114.1 hypothetical protein cubi_02916 [Cryptosporidium ubiquitum]